MLEEVGTISQSFDRYRDFTPQICDEAEKIAYEIQGLRVLHLNSTAKGGGVAELLKTQVPLERSVGLNSSWFVLQFAHNFFVVTKKMHNLLQGRSTTPLRVDEEELYCQTIAKAADSFREIIVNQKPDIVVIHDPQPLFFINYLPAGPASILRLHIDLSTPHSSTLKFFQPSIVKYDRLVVSAPDYRFSWFPSERTEVIMPAIDPFIEKNQVMPESEAKEVLSSLKVDIKRPFITQVSRIDPWKDPVGVIQTYRLARKKIPGLQLILVASAASDDPEADQLLPQVKKAAAGDPDIFLFVGDHFNGIPNSTLVRAVQQISLCVLQKSTREGFGLTVTEAMWKGNVVIGGKTVGISLQISHGKNGFLVSSSAEAAEYIIKVSKDEQLRSRLGKEARQTVKNKFLFSRKILDFLKLYAKCKG